MRRGQPATTTHLRILKEPVTVGAGGMYEARCRGCFVPDADAPTVHSDLDLLRQGNLAVEPFLLWEVAPTRKIAVLQVRQVYIANAVQLESFGYDNTFLVSGAIFPF